MLTSPLLTITGLRKSYSGVPALRGVDLQLMPGQIHALVGENGAGKSTLIKVLSSVEHADDGEIEFAGKRIHLGSAALPVSVLHQDLALVDELTIAENLCLGADFHVGGA